MKKSLRISCFRYRDDNVFSKHIEFIRKNIKYIDEITLFTEYAHHGYWDEEYINNNAEILKERVLSYREAGVKSIGLNVLCTIGHHDEAWSVLPDAPLPCQVDDKGALSKTCLCYNNAEYLEYIAKKYATYAGTGIDFIWIDDDIRLVNFGQKGCFCDDCVKQFNEQNNTSLRFQ